MLKKKLLFQKPHKEIRKLADFLGVTVTDEFISDVIDVASLENMQAGVGKTQQAQALYRNERKE